jgi:hypothetical protein
MLFRKQAKGLLREGVVARGVCQTNTGIAGHLDATYDQPWLDWLLGYHKDIC